MVDRTQDFANWQKYNTPGGSRQDYRDFLKNRFGEARAEEFMPAPKQEYMPSSDSRKSYDPMGSDRYGRGRPSGGGPQQPNFANDMKSTSYGGAFASNPAMDVSRAKNDFIEKEYGSYQNYVNAGKPQISEAQYGPHVKEGRKWGTQSVPGAKSQPAAQAAPPGGAMQNASQPSQQQGPGGKGGGGIPPQLQQMLQQFAGPGGKGGGQQPPQTGGADPNLSRAQQVAQRLRGGAPAQNSLQSQNLAGSPPVTGGENQAPSGNGVQYDENTKQSYLLNPDGTKNYLSNSPGGPAPEPTRLPPLQPGRLPPIQPGQQPEPTRLPPIQPGQQPEPTRLPPIQPGQQLQGLIPGQYDQAPANTGYGGYKPMPAQTAGPGNQFDTAGQGMPPGTYSTQPLQTAGPGGKGGAARAPQPGGKGGQAQIPQNYSTGAGQ